jgi:hypothetical protein
MVAVDWPGALAWRLERQLLAPVRPGTTAQVVGALGAVAAGLEPAWSELGIRARRAESAAGDVRRAVDDGELIATFAFRGAVHLMTPESAAVHSALRASSRMWERANWREFYRLEPGDWPDLVSTVRDALGGRSLTRTELAEAVTAWPAYAHLRAAFADPSLTFLKPLAWQGALCFGRPRDGQATFQLPDNSPGWPGLPDLDDAGPRAVRTYLRAYAPASPANLQYWLGEGLGVRRGLVAEWLGALGDRVQAVEVAGEERHVLAEDLDTLAAARRAAIVRLLPKYDQWVLGPGTAEQSVVPAAIRGEVSRGAHLVVVGGVVAGTWALVDGRVTVAWAPGAVPAATDALDAEVERLGALLGQDLTLADDADP